uniref:CULT domain-containing protein n=1 Tax=Globodera pallida TaxID=36090 RepID=A0A183C910_GLOPA
MFPLKCPSNAIFTLFLLVFVLQEFQFASADLLCRNCGHLVTTAPALKNVMSPRAIEHWNLTVLGVETVVQVFKNSVPETFNLITANGADLKFSGKSYAEDTWFPGMRWTPCVCSSCSSHIGWYFEAQKDDFVGLVLDYLISAEYADTLTKVPFG